MASGPITSWQIYEETMEKARDFTFLGSKIIAHGDCSHEIKRRLLLRRKAMADPDSILKSNDITLLKKVHLVKVMAFPVMYGCEGCTVQTAQCLRIDAFELWGWRKLLRVPWTARRSNQSILKEIKPWILIGRTDAEAEVTILWPPYVKNWHLKRPWCWEGLKAGEGDDRGWDGWIASPTQRIWVLVNSGS